MYQTLTFLHSLTRWLVLTGLLAALVMAIRGLLRRSSFPAGDNAVRHWSATIAHVQLVLGMLLYFRSPSIKFYRSHSEAAGEYPELRFFSMIHPLCMLMAIVLLTIGSGLAKRREAAASKYRTILIWYGLALLIMILAIPWPFSPFASRPYWR
jgi:hypothetical protein